MLSRLIYHSRVAGEFSSDTLNSILVTCEQNNSRDAVTGALLFNSVWFVQVLEGEREVLSRTLSRLFHDARHTNVTVMDVRPTEERMFEKWWMGAAALDGLDPAFLKAHGIDSQFDPRRLNGEAILLMSLGASDRLVHQVADG